ncbi:MAG TPA: CinA family nicotinamide mononucleotide deamidase-related protein [Flavipsychrobacter sp.]|nr:CinA family nicotinamide mononucleotide deamidase-related protein [Flavipsychrobacter sp.]
MSNIQASIITIGDELLIGQTIDTNSAWIAQRLNDLGIDVIRRVAVGDEKSAIWNALDEELSKVSLVLITGGLGPTSDDITKPLLCEYFGAKMKVDEKVLQHLKEIFTKRNRPFLERNLKQAEVPDNCTVLFNKMGTAPGMWFEKDEKVVISMPGVPFEMMGIMEDGVIDRLQQRFTSDALLHRSIVTAGEGESYIADKIEDLENALPPHIKLAYLPGYGSVKLRLTGRGNDKLRLANELQLRQEEIANRLENIVVALDDLPLEYILGKCFIERGLTLGLAESCTGGYIAHYITQVMGSAGYFNGSIVCYQESVKEDVLGVKRETLEKYGVVSEETAVEMVLGAREVLKSDYSFAVTGLLSAGGESDRVPVGTVWMAVADKNNVKTKRHQFHYDRQRNKELATQMGMLMIWKMLNNKL